MPIALDLKRTSRTGLNVWAGTVDEEWLKDLRGPRGIKVYREMADNDPVVGAMLFVLRMMIRSVDWEVVEGPDEDTELSDAGEFLQSCMGDMGTQTWDDFIDEAASFLEFGWAANEILWKVRRGMDTDDPKQKSKFTDGRIGWRGLPVIGQETLDEWVWDDDGQLEGLYQSSAVGTTNDATELATGQRPFVPRSKFVHTRTSKRKDNPEGRSVLRNAYRPWYFKKHIEMYEGIGIERDLAGYPVMRAPHEIFMENPPPEYAGLRSALEEQLRSVKRDESEGLLLPNAEAGYDFELLKGSGARQFDTGDVIERKNREILFSTVSDFVTIGHETVGSFALNVSKVGLFVQAVNSFLGMLAESINNDLVTPTLEMNGLLPAEAEDIPMLKPSSVSARDVAEKADILLKLSQAGQLPFSPVPDLVNNVLRDFDMPSIDEEDFDSAPMPPVMGPGGAFDGEF